ncbi:E3 ubiquitin-protein ligase ORTHRUS 2-like [Gastrolobium bilobum]|uniref:E3 ubiquitin-protein ligase ORTHRUS 2-like n=1 Tax=Gastrolobium bilobum TaxID=150636 RepID=UPI002AAF315C|nr:E3 ubiquitin-protein ligase ORTHRUS 2-like [Gastrolobium bilobum]
MSQLPCDSEGVCMVCKTQPSEGEKLNCFTCGTPWHVACVSNLPATLANTVDWVCPDCSNLLVPPPPALTPNDASGNLIAAMLAVESDASLTVEEKARRRQELMTGKTIPEEHLDNIKKNDVSEILSRTLNCSICIQLPERPVTTPCGHTFCLNCFEKWIRQGKRTCAKCRQSIPAKMANQPRINSALVFAIRMARASKNNGGGGPSGVHHFVHNQNKPDQPYVTGRAQRNGRANAASGKIFVTVPSDHFGPIPPENDPVRNQGLLVGESWPDRLECRQWGAHFVPVGGIAGQSNRGAQSVVLSGGYVDDQDHGEWFLYTGSGGKDLSGNKRTNKTHSFDQKFEKYNRSLQVSCLKGYPVRVVRSHKEKRSSYAPESGVRYDGIYRIEKCWQIAGLQGFKVCRYLFVRCDNEPAPWTSDDHGDRPRPLPAIRELKKATTIFERTETPSWDFDEEDSCWKWKKPPPPSEKKVQTQEPVEIARLSREIRKSQTISIKEQLSRGFSCLICRQVMVSPVTTPCGHSFCKSCLEGAFAGQAFVKDRSRGGRTLRSQKNVMKCPTCPIDISDYLQNLQVDVDLKAAIESLKAKAEENGESGESDEDSDGLQEDSAGTDEHTGSVNKNSVEELNDSPEGSDVGELKVTNEVPDPAVKRNTKRKKADSGEKLPEMSDGKMAKKGKRYSKRMAEKAVDEGNDSPSSPLNLPLNHD